MLSTSFLLLPNIVPLYESATSVLIHSAFAGYCSYLFLVILFLRRWVLHMYTWSCFLVY